MSAPVLWSILPYADKHSSLLQHFKQDLLGDDRFENLDIKPGFPGWDNWITPYDFCAAAAFAIGIGKHSNIADGIWVNSEI